MWPSEWFRRFGYGGISRWRPQPYLPHIECHGACVVQCAVQNEIRPGSVLDIEGDACAHDKDPAALKGQLVDGIGRSYGDHVCGENRDRPSAVVGVFGAGWTQVAPS